MFSEVGGAGRGWETYPSRETPSRALRRCHRRQHCEVPMSYPPPMPRLVKSAYPVIRTVLRVSGEVAMFRPKVRGARGVEGREGANGSRVVIYEWSSYRCSMCDNL